MDVCVWPSIFSGFHLEFASTLMGLPCPHSWLGLQCVCFAIFVFVLYLCLLTAKFAWSVKSLSTEPSKIYSKTKRKHAPPRISSSVTAGDRGTQGFSLAVQAQSQGHENEGGKMTPE